MKKLDPMYCPACKSAAPLAWIENFLECLSCGWSRDSWGWNPKDKWRPVIREPRKS